MKITYIYHSCFVAEDERALIVFDYWQDPIGELHEILAHTTKSVYWVNSHFHEDHYNPEMLTLEGKKIVSYDTKKRRRVADDQVDAVMRPDDVYADERVRIQAFKSTDVGLCYLATMPNGQKIFHAGDCNNWYFERGDEHLKVTAHEMEGLYLSILKRIAACTKEADHVMFPIDPRLEEHTLRGAKQWLNLIDTRNLYPMHTWGMDITRYLDELQHEYPNLNIIR